MSLSPARRLFSAPFHHLASRLVPILSEMAGEDPLRPRRVLLLSGRLRDHLQVRLVREGPLAGVSFLTLEQLARELAEPGLLRDSLRVLPALGGVALMDAVLKDLAHSLGPLRPPEGVQGYGGALYETWKDIQEGCLTAADLRTCARKLPRSDTARLTDLIFILESFEDRLRQHRLFDESQLLAKACEILEAAPDEVPTVLYGFSDMNALQRRFAKAVVDGSDCAAFVPADRDAPACAYARPFLRWLEAEGFTQDETLLAEEGPFEKLGKRLFGVGEPARSPKSTMQVVSAPAASREAFELCRELLHPGDKPQPPDSAGLLLPSRKDYDPLFREVLSDLGVPVDVPDDGSRAACPTGRSYLRMLAIALEGYTRPEVMRFLDEGNFHTIGSFLERLKDAGIEVGAAAPADWEYHSRDLPYLSSEDDWRREIRRALEKQDHDPVLASLAIGLEILFEQLGKLPESAPPSRHAEKSLEAFHALTSNLDRSHDVAETIRSLGELDEILGEVSTEEFHRWARLALEDASLPAERGSTRTQLMTLQQARGLSFETVVIPGLAEGVFPSRGSQDPILPDALRTRLNDLLSGNGVEMPERLPLKAGRSAEERFLFWTAIQAAEQRIILGYPTSGNGTGEERDCPPSLFLGYLNEAAGNLAERAAATALERDVLEHRPISLLEHDLSGMLEQLHGKQKKGALSHLSRNRPGFFRRIHAWRDRWQRDELTPFDGAFSPPDLIGWFREHRDPEKNSVTVTSLETFFSCPYQYALIYLLGLTGKDESERVLDAAADLRGNLYHETLKRFAEHVKKSGQGFGELTPAVRRDLITQSATAAFRAFERENQTPPSVTWRILRETIERDLNIFFADTYHKAPGWKPVEMEGRFGGEDNPQFCSVESDASVLIRGRFDLVEQEEKNIRFIDYKSGRYTKPSLVGGANLQGDLYAQYGSERFGESARVGAAYAYISERGGYRLAEIPPETIEARSDDVKALLGFYLRVLEAGSFFPVPSNVCDYCDFVSICGPERGGRANRKKGHPLWTALGELRERTK